MREGGVKLPFSSARFGRRPARTPTGRAAWSISGDTYPLGKDRNYVGMAKSIYGETQTGRDGLQAAMEGLRLTQNPNQAVDKIGGF